jgi:hypothetical protein
MMFELLSTMVIDDWKKLFALFAAIALHLKKEHSFCEVRGAIACGEEGTGEEIDWCSGRVGGHDGRRRGKK